MLRYSALLAGIFYGFSHQRTITANNAAAHAHAEYQHKADLIQKAKLEWAKKTLPPQAKTASGDGMSCDDESMEQAFLEHATDKDGSNNGSQR